MLIVFKKNIYVFYINVLTFIKGFLSLLPLVVSHYSLFPLKCFTAQKCHSFVRDTLKNAIFLTLPLVKGSLTT